MKRDPVAKCQVAITHAVSRARFELIGKEALLNTIRAGEYNGRRGAITDVMVSGDKLVALVMVWRKLWGRARPGERRYYLNTKKETRTYWPLDAFKLTGRQVFVPTP